MVSDNGSAAGEPELGTGLGSAMSDLAQVLQRSHRSVEETLRAITDSARELVAAADEASISLVVERRAVESRAATSSLPIEIDALQHSLGEGPCLDAVWENTTCLTRDLSTESRWPRFAPAAVGLGVRSMLSFRLFTDSTSMGALNLLSRRPDAFGEDDIESGKLVATHAAVALVGARTEGQLQSALATRDVIGQAKGMIMERFGLDAVAAFEMIRTLSQQMNIPVSELAALVVARRHH